MSKSGGQEEELADLQKELADAKKENASLQKKVEKFSEAAGEAATLKEKATALKQHLKEATAELDIVSGKYKEEQVKRKRLLNELEDLKGKVRVYCRVRPFSKTELAEADRSESCCRIIDDLSITVGLKGRPKDYNFDSVFGGESTQEEVFEDTKRLI